MGAFPEYIYTFLSSASKEKILDFFDVYFSKENYFLKKSGTSFAVYEPKTQVNLYYNSFIPCINIHLEERESVSVINLKFSLLNSVKWIISMIVLFVVFLEGSLFFLWWNSQLSSPLLTLIPLGIAFLVYGFSKIFLLLSTKQILGRIEVEMTKNNLIEEKLDK